MVEGEVDKLSRIASKCREGLQSLGGSQGSMFNRFPKGSCGPATELIGRAIKEGAGYDGFYVCGSAHARLEPCQSHAWYEVGDYIVDITYDQFNETGLTGFVFSLINCYIRNFVRPGGQNYLKNIKSY